MNADRNMPRIVTNNVKPVRPAAGLFSIVMISDRCLVPTWTNVPFSLKGSNASEACHGEEIEEYLRNIEDDSWFRNNHLVGGESVRGN